MGSLLIFKGDSSSSLYGLLNYPRPLNDCLLIPINVIDTYCWRWKLIRRGPPLRFISSSEPVLGWRKHKQRTQMLQPEHHSLHIPSPAVAWGGYAPFSRPLKKKKKVQQFLIVSSLFFLPYFFFLDFMHLNWFLKCLNFFPPFLLLDLERKLFIISDSAFRSWHDLLKTANFLFLLLPPPPPFSSPVIQMQILVSFKEHIQINPNVVRNDDSKPALEWCSTEMRNAKEIKTRQAKDGCALWVPGAWKG